MPLRETLEKQGNWLFKWRSYLPLLFLPVVLIALRDAGLLQKAEGDLIDDIREALCVIVSFTGLFIRTTGKHSATPYLGNLIIFLGGVLFIPVLWFDLLAVFSLCLYYIPAMLAQERSLRKKFGDSWRKPLFAVIAGFTFLDLAEDFFANGKFEFDWGWVTFFAAGLVIYAVSGMLNKGEASNGDDKEDIRDEERAGRRHTGEVGGV